MHGIGLEKWLIKLSEKLNYQRPTPVQKLVIPAILQGSDILANSETGSGKTASFAFPILQNLAKDPFGIYALIITPNRELAFQIAEQVLLFGASVNIRVSTIVGGLDMTKQALEIHRIPHILIGTPGRLLDQIERDPKLRELLKFVRYLVLDEADRLVEDSIVEDVRTILQYIPKERQNILTTATVTKKLEENLKWIFQDGKEFKRFDVNKEKKTVESLTQQYVLVPDDVKEFYFIHLMKKFQDKTCIVKCHTLSLLLKEMGFDSTCLHSYLPQSRRLINLKVFRNGKSTVLVATDVASRGLDIQTVDLVINYDVSYNASDYIHRVGRTARKGKRGLAISLVTQYDIELLKNIEDHIGDKLEALEVNEREVLESMSDVNKARKMVKIKMHESGIEEQFEANAIYKKKIANKRLKKMKQFQSNLRGKKDKTMKKKKSTVKKDSNDSKMLVESQ